MNIFARAAVVAGINPATFNAVAQTGHFVGGALAVLAPVALISPVWCFVGGVGIVLFAAGKEFWWDYRYESTEVRGSSLEDFLFYVFGALVALAAYLGSQEI
jgi:hypothetical protein